jgi:hypothetical protein
MSGLPDVQENNEQILNDIQSLQQMEQQLFSSLETNPNLTTQQQEQIIQRMNQLSNMRIGLYKTLSGVNNFFQNALSSSTGTLQEQTAAIAIVESELNRAKKRLELLEEEKSNKIRLVEINDYYGDKYAEHADLMKIVIFTLVPVIILAILNNKGILPNMPYYILVSIVAIIGSIYFWYRFASLIMRDNMVYQEYQWPMPPTNKTGSSSSISDPWGSIGLPGTCIGDACCSAGQTYDASLNQCIGDSTVESFVTESMLNSVLTKTSGISKPSYTLNADSKIQPNSGNSFINYKH